MINNITAPAPGITSHYINQTPVNNVKQTNVNKPVEDTKSDSFVTKHKKEIIIGSAIAGAAALIAVVVNAKRGRLGSELNNSLNGAQSQAPVSPIHIKDNLGYEILPPKVGNSTIAADESLYEKYVEIINNSYDGTYTQTRYEEVINDFINTSKELSSKISNALGHKASAEIDSDTAKFLIAKKRYFAIDKNKTQGYSCLDPLEYQVAREEAFDINLGYQLIEPLNEKSQSQLLNELRSHFGSQVSKEDSKFIDECVSKLLPENAKCYGKDSVLRTFELSRLGKIFRELLNIQVK